MFSTVRAVSSATLVAAIASVLFSGTSARGQWQYPIAVAVSDGGEILVADKDLPGIWQVTDGQLKEFFEGSKKFRTPLNAVRSLAFGKDGQLLAGDSSTREVYRFDEQGKPVPLSAGTVGIPMGIAVGPEGALYVSDLELHRIVKLPAEGGQAEPVADVQGVAGLTIDDEQRLWAVSRTGGRLLRIGTDGQIETLVEPGVFQFPHDVVLDANQTAYISDGYAHAIWKMAPGEEPHKWVQGDPLQNPVAMAWKDDLLLVIDSKAKALFQIAPDGKITQLFPAP